MPSASPTAPYAFGIFASIVLCGLAIVVVISGASPWYVVLTAVCAVAVAIVVAMLRRDDAADAADTPADPSAGHEGLAIDEEPQASWDQRALAFALDLRASVAHEQLHQTIAQKLPALLGVEQMWIVTRIGDRQQIIVPSRGGDATNLKALYSAPGEWATFPLQVGPEIIGVLGVEIGRTPLAPGAKRALASLAPLIADSIHTAHTIAHLREMSTIDSVTGCATRQEGLQRLRAELRRAHRTGQDLAVLMLDLDYFKSINDRYGHQCGDAVLAAVGRTIMQTLRVSDLRCRWGGEEFLVALPETGLDQARHVAVALARRIAATVTEFDSARIRLTVSIGVTTALKGEEDPEGVVARADAGLYRAKADGRNCIRIVPPTAAFREASGDAAEPAGARAYRVRATPV